MTRKILITGAGSGFGEGAAIGLARLGHEVIAAAHLWPQVTALRLKAKELGLPSLRIEKLDLLDAYDVKQAAGWDFDVLVNNAGMGEGGPIAEIPLDIVRKNFEINVFAPLALTQLSSRNGSLLTSTGRSFLFRRWVVCSARRDFQPMPRRNMRSKPWPRRCMGSSNLSAFRYRPSTPARF